MDTIGILIIAHPGANLDSLFAVLPALVPDAQLYIAQDIANTKNILTERQPYLVLVDCEIGYNDARLIHKMITTQFPAVRIIFLSDAAHWQIWKAISPPHQVLLKGFSTRRLRATLANALSTRVDARVHLRY